MPALGLGLGLTFARKIGQAALLDQFSGSLVAYSTRNLSASTTNVVRVRESGGDTEQDFTSAELTDGTLATFCGANDGFVVTWYDQSGNSNNATQATTTKQPLIVSSGTVLVDGNGQAVVRHVSDDRLFSVSGITENATAMLTLVHSSSDTAFALIDSTSGNDYAAFAQDGSASTLIDNFVGTPSYYVNAASQSWSTRDDAHTALATGSQQLVAVSDIDMTQASGDYDGGLCVYNYYSGIGNSTAGDLSEFIVWGASTDRAAIETSINSHYSIY